jgi:hypothetical protein
MKQLIFIIISFLFIGCIKKYKFTAKICGGQLFVESYNVNPAGVDEDYLTDSLNFRVFVGKYDNEHDNFNYQCQKDSIRINRLGAKTDGNKMANTDSKIFSLSDLKNKKPSSNKPLFEFK